MAKSKEITKSAESTVDGLRRALNVIRKLQTFGRKEHAEVLGAAIVAIENEIVKEGPQSEPAKPEASQPAPAGDKKPETTPEQPPGE